VVDANGNLVNSYDYNAWGEIREQNETVSNPFLWQTKPWDEEVTLYYSRARYYEGKTGRFLGVDPVCRIPGFTGGRDAQSVGDRYGFGLQNPTCRVDYTGLADEDHCAKCKRYAENAKDDCRGLVVQLGIVGIIPVTVLCVYLPWLCVAAASLYGLGCSVTLEGCNDLGKKIYDKCIQDSAYFEKDKHRKRFE